MERVQSASPEPGKSDAEFCTPTICLQADNPPDFRDTLRAKRRQRRLLRERAALYGRTHRNSPNVLSNLIRMHPRHHENELAPAANPDDSQSQESALETHILLVVRIALGLLLLLIISQIFSI